MKNNYRINLILAVLFFAGVAASAFMVFRIPFVLRITSGSGFLTVLYVTLAVTFIIGGIALMRALQYKEELIVYRERTQEMKKAEEEAEERKNEISLDTVKSAIKSGDGSEKIQNALNAICKQLNAGQGAYYLRKTEDGNSFVELTAGFAFSVGESNRVRYELGEGLIGQAADSGQVLYLDELPEGYIKIISGLGSASPKYLLINPLKSPDGVVGVIEIATFAQFSKEQRKFVEQCAELIAQELSNTKG